MKTAVEPEFRRSGQLVSDHTAWSQRWFGRLTLLSLSVAMLTLSYAPMK